MWINALRRVLASRGLPCRPTVLAGVLGASLAAFASASEASRPNFVVIISDDQGSSDLSLYPPSFPFIPPYESQDKLEGRVGLLVDTPNIDSLAHDGVRINRFYVQPHCLPTRASFYTGALDHAWMYRADWFGRDSIPADTPTIAERFQEADYQTVLLGKWQLGRAPHAHPNAKGFEHFYGFLGGWIDYFAKTGDTRGEFDWQRNGSSVFQDVGRWAPTQLVDEALELLEERDQFDDERPLFLVLSFPSPHGPISAPPEFIEEACEVSRFACYYRAAINAMDVEVGRLLDALDEHGLTDDTLVMFFTDNGGGWNYPFRGTKFSTYEGGIRVGALARFPGRLRRDVKHPIQVQDLWATFERAANLERRAPPTSVDRWRALRGRGPSQPWRPMFFSNRRDDCINCCCWLWYAHWRKSSAVLVGPWKLHKGRDFTGPPHDEQPVAGTEFLELYNVRRDPREAEDLLEGHPWLRDFLSFLIDWWDPPVETL